MALLILMLGQGFRIDRHALRWSLYGGAFCSVMVYGLISSVVYIPVSVAVLIFFTHPILIAAISHWRGGDRLTPRKLLLACCALAGLVLVVGAEFGNLDPVGVGLAALSALAICGMILCSAKAQKTATSTQVNFYVTGMTGLVFVPLTPMLSTWSLPVNTVGWLGIAGASAGIAIGLLTYFASFRYISPVRATMLSNLEPLVGILVAALILGERLALPQWAGVAMVIGALVMFEAADRDRA
jgi:drug/metabolite transporter (DMT)-like permease